MKIFLFYYDYPCVGADMEEYVKAKTKEEAVDKLYNRFISNKWYGWDKESIDYLTDEISEENLKYYNLIDDEED